MKTSPRAHSLFAQSGASDSRPTFSSGLYIVKANTLDVVDERHYVIYWPEDTTWDDSATSSVRRNRVTFMRWVIPDYLCLITSIRVR